MNESELIKKFREEAMQNGLLIDLSATKRVDHFKICLPRGDLQVPREPEKMYKLLKLALEMAKAAGDPRYGDHKAMLRMATPREDLDAPVVVWFAGAYARARQKPHDWIMLGDYLKQRGYDLSEFEALMADDFQPPSPPSTSSP